MQMQKLLSNPKFPKLLVTAALLYAVIYVLSATGVFNGYVMVLINQSLIYVILAVSLNLINGITGQFSLGHMGFAAVGAYASGVLSTLVFKLSPLHTLDYASFVLVLIAGGVAAAIVGFLIGFPSLRLKGDYLAIVTLGFGEIIRTVVNSIDYVGGSRGLNGIPKFSVFTVIYVATFVTIVVIRNLVETSTGRSMRAIRDNELAAELVGINSTRYKVTAFIVGAFFAGIAGGLLAHLLQLAHPTQYGFMGSVLIVIMVYAGGVGSLTGSILAAFVLTFLQQGLAYFIEVINNSMGTQIGTEWRMVIYSLLLIFIMLFRTSGLMGNREAKLLVIDKEEA